MDVIGQLEATSVARDRMNVIVLGRDGARSGRVRHLRPARLDHGRLEAGNRHPDGPGRARSRSPPEMAVQNPIGILFSGQGRFMMVSLSGYRSLFKYESSYKISIACLRVANGNRCGRSSGSEIRRRAFRRFRQARGR